MKTHYTVGNGSPVTPPTGLFQFYVDDDSGDVWVSTYAGAQGAFAWIGPINVSESGSTDVTYDSRTITLDTDSTIFELENITGKWLRVEVDPNGYIPPDLGEEIFLDADLTVTLEQAQGAAGKPFYISNQTGYALRIGSGYEGIPLKSKNLSGGNTLLPVGNVLYCAVEEDPLNPGIYDLRLSHDSGVW